MIGQSYKVRKHRGSQNFRAPYDMPRSAPVSPTMDSYDRQRSPLNEMMLQSAPHSPDAGGMQAYSTSHEELVVNTFVSGNDGQYVSNGAGGGPNTIGIKRQHDGMDTMDLNPDDCDGYENSIKRKYQQ